MKTITVVVSPDGQAKVETKGFSGSECLEASEFIEKSLGERLSEKRTAEYYQQQKGKNDVRTS